MCLSIGRENQIEQDELSMFEYVCEPKEGGRATGFALQPYNITISQPHSIAHHSCCSSSVVQTQQVVLFCFVLFCSALKGVLLFFACMYIFVRPSELNLTR